MLRVLIAFVALVTALPAAAQAVVRNPHTNIVLASESLGPAPGGKAALAIVMTPETGWHTYWKNPGAAGIETKAAWTLPPGVNASAIRYPVPKTFLVSGITNYVFEGETVLLVDLVLPMSLSAGSPLPVRVRLDYLVCDDKLCVPESAELAIDLRIGGGEVDAAAAELFDSARKALPRPVDWPATFERSGTRLRIGVDTAGIGDVNHVYFFPEADGVLDYDAPQQVRRDGKRLIVDTLAGPDRSHSLTGVLRIERRDGSLFGASIEAAPGKVQLTGQPLTSAGTTPSSLMAIGFAILGGLLLNIMPCVFPILGLKALSLARGGASETDARREALAYTAGVMFTCLALGSGIIALRAAGAQIGWAFQLQDPRVILLLLLLVTAIALNLLGVFELRAPRIGSTQAPGAFWTGVLAAIVATPCTGPFMGIALGAAILLPPMTGLLIFAGLGFGLALPFLAIGFIPALRRCLPKSGPWLLQFRRLMALPMLATGAALAWVLWRQTGGTGLAIGAAAALVLGAGLWLWGNTHRCLMLVLAAIPVVAAAFVPMQVRRAGPVEAIAALPDSERFSESRLEALRASHTPVFVYFTADWCITCKVNEKGALSSPEVARAFAEAGIVNLVGDWTNADPAITRFLESQGRAGVPLYVFYDSGGGETVLPQLLDTEALVELAD